MPTRTFTLVVMGIFIALAVTMGFALMSLPNVEMVTAIIFMAGYFLGPVKGALVGLVAEFLYAVLNPYGMSALPLLLAQILCMALVGFTGGVVGKGESLLIIKPGKILLFGLCGLVLTFIFDMVTTFSFLIFAGLSTKAVFLSGLGFYLVHILTNTAIFMSILPLMIKGLEQMEFLKKAI